MKLRWLLLATHLSPLALGGAALAVGMPLEGDLLVPLLAGAAALGVALAWFVGSRIRRGLRVLERVAATGDGADLDHAGIRELDEAAERLREYAHRWSEAATNSREQSRAVERLLLQINRRAGQEGTAGEPSAAHQLRQILAGLIHTADSDLQQILNSAGEIERCTQEIASGAEDQAEAVSKSTTYVEQMSGNIDSISQNAGGAHSAAVVARDSSGQALELVQELVRGMDRIRMHVEAGEKKLRALGDRSHEIGSIVETIGTISSRTDLLALNASIESVRAGEHGRGFAVVADEVRNLAEQAAQATREVAGLIESIQLETQESIAVMLDERSQVEEEVRRVGAAGEALERINRASGDSASRVDEISRSTQQQLRLMQDVVMTMERISEVAKSNRSRAEGVCWITKNLTKLAGRLDESLSPLRGCSDQTAAENGARGSGPPDQSGRAARGGSGGRGTTANQTQKPPSGELSAAEMCGELVEVG